MSISFDNAFGLQAAALKLRDDRHQMLSENLANADTPNYKARDMDFRAAMQAVQDQRQGQLAPVATHGGHIQPAGGAAEPSTHDALGYRVPHSPALDGNTVEGQVEQAKFAENTVHYQAGLNFLGGRITSMIGAIRGE